MLIRIHPELWRRVLIRIHGSFQLSLHIVLRYLRPEYAHLTSVSPYNAHIQPQKADPISSLPVSFSAPPSSESLSEYDKGSNGTRRANAVLLMLVRNSELEDALSSVTQLEERFNKRFGYPWVFLNDEPFSDEFKQ